MKLIYKAAVLSIALLIATLALVTCDGKPIHHHSFEDEWSYDDVWHWHDSSCGENDSCGSAIADYAEHIIFQYKCTECGYEIYPDDDNTGDDGTDDAPGEINPPDDNGNDTPPTCVEHHYVSEEIKAPSCTEQGETKYTCDICGDSYVEATDALGHTEVTVPGYPPTCDTYGMSGGKECSVCNEILKQQIEIAPTGHSFSDGFCLVCGDADPDYVPIDPYVIYTSTTDNNCWKDKVSFTATESGMYTFHLPAGLGAWDAKAHANGRPGPVVDSLHPNYIPNESDFTVAIVGGETYDFYIAAVTKQDWEIRWDFVACDVDVSGDNGQTAPTELVVGKNVIDGCDVEFCFTAASAGELTLITSGAISGSVEMYYSINGGESRILPLGASTTLTLSDGDLVLISVVADGYSAINTIWDGEISDVDEELPFDISGEYTATDAFGSSPLKVIIDASARTVVFDYYHHMTGPNVVHATYKVRNGAIVLYDENGNRLHPLSGTLLLVNGVPSMASFNAVEYSLTIGSPDDGEGNLDGEIVIKGEMIDEQENTFTVTAKELSVDRMYVNFIPLSSGVYDFMSKHIFVERIFHEDGTPAEKNEYDFYILQAYVKYIVEINLEYVAHIGNYTITPEYQLPEGHSKNPFWYTLGESVTAEYKGDFQPVWYQFYADVTGILNITTKTPGATVMVAAVPNFDISATDTISLGVEKGRKYYIGVAVYDSNDAVGITFSATITEGEFETDGSVNTPHHFEIGENSFAIDSSDGLYFIYKATLTGTITLSHNGASFSWCFTDFVEPINTVREDISVHLELGDIVYLYIETDDTMSDEVSFNVSLKGDPKQVWINDSFVLDGSAANPIELEDNTFALFQINGKIGRFSIAWDNPDAVVIVDDRQIQNGEVIDMVGPWFGPYIKVYIDDYTCGTVNITITNISVVQ